jgi:hypothetical protein
MMQIHERKIGGVIYRFAEVVGWEAHFIMVAALRIGKPVFDLLGADDDNVFAALGGAIQGHDEREFMALGERLFKHCKADGEDIVVGVKPGSLIEIYQLLAFCLKAQFSDFLGARGREALAQIKKDLAANGLATS